MDGQSLWPPVPALSESTYDPRRPGPRRKRGDIREPTSHAAAPKSSAIATAPESTGPDQAEDIERAYELDVGASIAEGRLRVEFMYSTARYERATITQLADTFAAALASFAQLQPARVGSDGRNTQAQVSADDLAAILDRMR